jgi:predicted RNA-binding Zn ribbon-like protein
MILWLEFVNSCWQDHLGRVAGPDRIADPAWLGQLAALADVPCPDPRTPGVGPALARLRGVIRTLVDRCLAGKALTDADLAPFNRYLAGAPVRPQLVAAKKAPRLEFRAQGAGPTALHIAVAASFADFLAHGDISRLRVCGNPTCQWVFLDATRSRTGRWCGRTCRSLIKVRECRRRQRKARRGGRKSRR